MNLEKQTLRCIRIQKGLLMHWTHVLFPASKQAFSLQALFIIQKNRLTQATIPTLVTRNAKIIKCLT